MGGKGIKIIDSKLLNDSLKNCSKNYIAEEYIYQHEFLNKIFIRNDHHRNRIILSHQFVD